MAVSRSAPMLGQRCSPAVRDSVVVNYCWHANSVAWLMASNISASSFEIADHFVRDDFRACYAKFSKKTL